MRLPALRSLRDLLRHPLAATTGRGVLVCAHWLRYASVAVALLVVIAITVLRLWIPSLGEKKAEIETFLSQKSTRPVRIEQLTSEWRGLRPQLRARGLYLLSEDGRKTAMRLESVDIRLALLPLLHGEVVLDRLTLRHPSLTVTRFEDGRIEIGDIIPGKEQRRQDDQPVVEWLLRQRNIEVEGGVLTWHDRKAGESPLKIADVHLSLANNGDRHRFNGSVVLPESVSHRLELAAEFNGTPFLDEDWSGNVNVDVATLNMAGLPQVLRSRLPEGLVGSIDTRARFDLDEEGLRTARGTIGIRGLELSLPGLKTPLRAHSLTSGFALTRDGDRRELILSDLNLWFEEQPWSAGKLQLVLDREAQRTQFSAQRLRMQELVNLVGKLRNESRVVQAIRELQPAGEADDLELEIRGDWRKPEAFELKTRLVNGSMKPYRKFPGVTAVNGVLKLDRSGGQFDLQTTDASVEFPELFAAALPVSYARGRIRWERHEDKWLIFGDKLEAGNLDGHGSGTMEIIFPVDRSLSPTLRLDVSMQDGNGAAVRRYLPVRRLNAKVTRWLERALVGGHVDSGTMRYAGKVREWPFVDSPGEFTVQVQVRDAILDYTAGWPRVEQGRGVLRFDKTSMTVVADSARIGGLDATGVQVQIADLRDSDKVVEVRGRLSGGLGPAMEFLKNGPLFKQAHTALAGMTLAGSGELELAVDVPAGDPEQTRVQGRYQLHDADLGVAEGVHVSGINTVVDFTDRSVTAPPVSARLLGGPVDLQVATPAPGRPPVVVVEARGHTDVQQLGPLLHPEVLAPLSGSAQWDGRLRFDADGVELDINTDLAGVAAAVPAPLSKTVGTAWPMILTTRFAGGQGRDVSFNIDGRVSGRMHYAPNSSGAGPEAGMITVGSGTPPLVPALGLGLHVSAPQLDLDSWIDYLKPVIRRQPDDGKQGLRLVSATVGSLKLLDRHFDQVNLSANRDREHRWDGVVQALELDGKFTYEYGARRKLALDLEQLHWNKETGNKDSSPAEHNWRELPALDVRSSDFRYGDMQLGSLRLQATPDQGGWEVDQLRCEQPQMTLEASGRWNIDGKNESSSYSVRFDTSDIGTSLDLLAVGRRIESGKAQVAAQLDWPGGPGAFSLGSAHAQISIDARDGRFPQLDPGAGRLFGLFNIDALTRRLRLDFTDIFNKGFAFDRIRGNLDIRDGTALTQDLFIDGPSADIAVTGRSGIVNEDYDLEIVVTPQLGGNLAVAGGVLGSPAAGAAIFLFQKVFQKQLGDLVKYRYQVTGPWTDPAMTRLESSSQG